MNGTPAESGTPGETGPIASVTVLPDFSVKTSDGGTFTLSEALKYHELVLINLCATWCGPCYLLSK